MSFISLICQNARLKPAFQMLRKVRGIEVPWDWYCPPIGGWILSTEGSGVGSAIVPGREDFAGTFGDA